MQFPVAEEFKGFVGKPPYGDAVINVHFFARRQRDVVRNCFMSKRVSLPVYFNVSFDTSCAIFSTLVDIFGIR